MISKEKMPQFYDLKNKKKVEVPQSNISMITKNTKKGRKVTMAVGTLSDGRKLYKITKNEKT